MGTLFLKNPNCYEIDIFTISQLLLRKEIVVLPTDTVYGFHSLVSKDLQEKINEIKGCAKDKPLITLDRNFISPIKITVPTTFIIDGRAVRNPRSRVIADVLAQVGQPLYSTSANLTGEPILTNGRDIHEKFRGKIAAVFDIGEIENKSSRIVKYEKGKWITIRE
ncbi:translation factor Sua5 [Clostridia bacterium]|nr:translation factor Sua5 [Clostridia bacterium]